MRRTDVLQGIRPMKFEEILERTRSRESSREAAGLVLGVLADYRPDGTCEDKAGQNAG